MIAIDWRYGGVLIVELLLTSAGIYFFSRATKIRTLLLRIAVSVICLFVSLLGSLAVLASLAFSGCETHSPMVYSPSGKIAARANNFDEGATGWRNIRNSALGTWSSKPDRLRRRLEVGWPIGHQVDE
jgi:hypothetical protein